MTHTQIFFATNRQPDSLENPTDFTQQFSTQDVDDLRFGQAYVPGMQDLLNYDVNRFDLSKIQIVTSSESLHSEKADQHLLGSRKIFEDLRESMRSGHQDTLFFIHGFGFSFKEAVFRAAQIKNYLGNRPMNVFLFSWPSEGRITPLFKAYHSDRVNAQASGIALARGMMKAVDYLQSISRQEYCRQRIHVMAHSMGVYALRFALQYVRQYVGDTLPTIFDQTILIAADEDDDALERDDKLRSLSRLSRHISVYYHHRDTALALSDFTKPNPVRLGTSGPRERRFVPQKFSLIDVSKVIDWRQDPTGHQYYRLNNRLCEDLLCVLNGIGDDSILGREHKEGYYLLLP